MIKTMTFTIMHFTIAFSVAYILTGDWVVGSAIAMVEPAVNSVGYFWHEKVWERIKQRERVEEMEYSRAVPQ